MQGDQMVEIAMPEWGEREYLKKQNRERMIGW